MGQGRGAGPIHLNEGALRATILPGLGAGLADLSLRGPNGYPVPLLRRAPHDAAHFNELACYLMAPWSNRIAGAAFEFGGRTQRLRPNWADGTAIHGDVCSRPWAILDRTPVSARLALDSRSHADANWPWPFVARVRYEIGAEAFATELSVTNLGDAPMPAGLGFHPYFMRRLWSAADDVRVEVRTAGRYPAAGMIPKGAPVADGVTAALGAGGPLGGAELDDVFAGFDGRATIRWPSSGVSLQFDCSPELGHAVVYSPARDHAGGGGRGSLSWFCVEPVSMVNDGFNRLAGGDGGTGVRTLAPGETLEVRWAMRIEGGE